MTTEDAIQLRCDEILTTYRTTAINYYPYVTGAKDIYGQREKTFATAVSLVGRAILKPTREKLSVIGDGETYEIAFLFSRLEMERKFPLADDGDWMETSGEMGWRDRRYKIEGVIPTGQVGTTFSLIVVVANSIPGRRDG